MAAAEGVKQVLARPIQLVDQVVKLSGEVIGSRQECIELKSKAEKLAVLLRQAARADLYERPTRRIMYDTSKALEKALALVSKYRSQQSNVVRRVFSIVSGAAFKKMSSLLENSAGDVSWLLRVSNSENDDDDDIGLLGLAPIASSEPYLCLIWEHIAKLQKGTEYSKEDAATALVSFAKDNERYGNLIIEEGGILPLLGVLKEGTHLKLQECAAEALGLLARDEKSVKAMVEIGGVGGGACAVFGTVLKEGDMKVQALVAWAVAEFAEKYPPCKDLFLHVVRFLILHLAFETVEEHSRYTIPPKSSSMHSVVIDVQSSVSGNDHQDGNLRANHPPGNQNGQKKIDSFKQHHHYPKSYQHQHYPRTTTGSKSRENEDLAVKTKLKTMAARALWQLAKGHPAICKNITESRALLCFAVLLEKGSEEVSYYSAMAVMEIARVAEQDAELRRSAFNPSSVAAKAIVDQLVRIVDNANCSDILVPCIMTLGCLSKTFRATENRIIRPLVCLLDDKGSDTADVSRVTVDSNILKKTVVSDVLKETVISLTKFACTENYLHKDHSKAIVAAGGIEHLVHLVYFGEKSNKIAALTLLCYVALHVPDSEELAKYQVLSVLELASKQNIALQDSAVEAILAETKLKLELYQSRSSKNF